MYYSCDTLTIKWNDICELKHSVLILGSAENEFSYYYIIYFLSRVVLDFSHLVLRLWILLYVICVKRKTLISFKYEKYPKIIISWTIIPSSQLDLSFSSNQNHKNAKYWTEIPLKLITWGLYDIMVEISSKMEIL